MKFISHKNVGKGKVSPKTKFRKIFTSVLWRFSLRFYANPTCEIFAVFLSVVHKTFARLTFNLALELAILFCAIWKMKLVSIFLRIYLRAYGGDSSRTTGIPLEFITFFES